MAWFYKQKLEKIKGITLSEIYIGWAFPLVSPTTSHGGKTEEKVAVLLS